MTSPPLQMVIVGSGPAAHTAAIYAARARLQPRLYEGFMAGGVAPGGQLTTTTEVENYPGFPTGISGPELMDKMKEQSIKCGTEILTETISRVDLTSRPFRIYTEAMVEAMNSGEPVDPVRTQSLIIATGATAKRMHLPGEETYWQAGISACAVCDGAAPIFRNKPLAVIGGGDSAVEEATYLTRYASKVYLLVRRDQLRASKVMQERALHHEKVEILWNTVAVEAKGDGRLLQSLQIENVQTKERRDLPVNGLFYAIGHQPNTDWLKDPKTGKYQVQCDADGYVVQVNKNSTETSVEGVFAAGDVSDKKYRQAITAAGNGCAAALDCERWLEAKEFEAQQQNGAKKE